MDEQYFSQKIKDELMLRAGLRCCNPNCRRITVAFNGQTITKIGEAAHICAQNEGGPRYTPNYDASQIDNGLWLCADCHTLIDKRENINFFTESVLREWKNHCENEYYRYLSQPRIDFSKYLAEKSYNGTYLNFNKLSDLQILLFIYSCCDYTIRFCISSDPDEDTFFDFYKNFYENWYVNSEQDILRNRLQISSLPSVNKLQLSNETLYYSLKEMFTSALLSDNFRNLILVKNKQVSLDPDKIYEKVFLSDLNQMEDFINYWYN